MGGLYSEGPLSSCVVWGEREEGVEEGGGGGRNGWAGIQTVKCQR